MVLSIIALCLVLGIVFFNFRFGLFSGLINAFCTVVAAVVAFAYFSPLAAFALKKGAPPGYAEAAILALLFIVTAIVLRSLADNLIRGNVRMPNVVDWVGGALCGFVIAQVCVGMMVITLSMLPLGDSVFGFHRMERDDEDTLNERNYVIFKTRGVWLAPDAFTTGLVSLLSNGSLAGSTKFASVYPNFPMWVSWTANTPQPEVSPAPYRGKTDGVKNGLTLVNWWEIPATGVRATYRIKRPTREDKHFKYNEPEMYRPEEGKRLIALRVTLNAAAAEEGKARGHHLFRNSMLRLVGETSNGPAEYAPRIIGGVDRALAEDQPDLEGVYRIADFDSDFYGNGDVTVDLVYEVDVGFEPWFVEYRRFARAEVKAGGKLEAPPEPLPPPGGLDAKKSSKRHGPTGLMGAVDDRKSGFRDEMPLKIDRVQAGQAAKTKGTSLVVGRLYGDVDAIKSNSVNAVSKFEVPDGMKLLQVRFEPYQAKSLAGQVFNFAAKTINQYHAVDSDGNKYPIVGYFAIVKRGEGKAIEIFYAGGDKDAPEAIAYGMNLDFKHIDGSELTNQASEAEVGLLFLVPPGKHIVDIVNQRGDGASVDFQG